MSWVTILWTSVITICLVTAGIHLALWYQQRKNRAALFIAIALLGISGLAMVEYLLMQSPDAQKALELLNWANLAVLVLLTGLAGFMHSILAGDRLWLAISAIGARSIGGLLVLLQTVSEVEPSTWQPKTLLFLGEPVSLVSAPTLASWWSLNELGNLLFLFYVLDASIRTWRLGDEEQRRSALWAGGSILLFGVLASGVSFLVNRQMIQVPYLVSPPFLVVVFILIWELTRQMARKNREYEAARERLSELDHRLRQLEHRGLLGHFSAALAHELGQPLGAILRNAEAGEILLQRDPSDSILLRQLLQKIREDDQRAMGILRRMQNLYHGNQLESEPLDMAALVGEIAQLVQPRLEAEGIRLEIRTGSNLPLVTGDGLLLQQVLRNLLDNARTALSGRRNGLIRIDLKSDPRGGLTLDIEDNGPGIDPEVRTCLFEPFCGGDPKGNGLGLAICSTIVEAHQGHLRLRYTGTRGTCFQLWLPEMEETRKVGTKE